MLYQRWVVLSRIVFVAASLCAMTVANAQLSAKPPKDTAKAKAKAKPAVKAKAKPAAKPKPKPAAKAKKPAPKKVVKAKTAELKEKEKQSSRRGAFFFVFDKKKYEKLDKEGLKFL